MIITREFLLEGKSDRGGWSRRQVLEIGGSWPLRPGWLDRLVGRDVTELQARAFLAMRNGHVAPRTVDVNAAAMNHFLSL